MLILFISFAFSIVNAGDTVFYIEFMGLPYNCNPNDKAGNPKQLLAACGIMFGSKVQRL
jgi:hypothetical protein